MNSEAVIIDPPHAKVGMPKQAGISRLTINGTTVYDGGDKNTAYVFAGTDDGYIYYTLSAGTYELILT